MIAAWLPRLLACAAIAWLVCVLAVSLFQEKLIFHPQTLSSEDAAALRGAIPGIEEAALEMRDGTVLRGWFFPGAAKPSAVVIYFGGNAEEVSWLVRENPFFAGRALAFFNYRGYGQSEGRPGEKDLYGDALEIYDWVRKRRDVDAGRIVVMGRSLGSGVAVHVAVHRPVQGVVLVSPYDAVAEMARETFPWLPVNLLLRHRFDSMEKAPGIRVPACFLIGAEDRTIPPLRSRKLAAVWGGKTVIREFPGADHNSLDGRPEYRAALAEFLDKL